MLVEFPVAESPFRAPDCNSFRCTHHLVFEQFMNTTPIWIVGVCVVPFHQHLLPFRANQQRQTANGRFRLIYSSADQSEEMTAEPFDRVRFPSLGIVMQLDSE